MDFQHKKIAILGFGMEGQSTLNFLIKQGILLDNITILDQNINLQIPEKIKLIIGDNYLDNLEKYDLIIKSPGISLYNPLIYKYKHNITSQVEIFFEYNHNKVIAITGTKGKSTTTTCVYQFLQYLGYKVKIVGNIGKPILSEIDVGVKYDYIIIELSSHQLDSIQKKNFISILLNIFPDHLIRHKGRENYQQAKLNILNGSDYNIVHYDLNQQYQLSDKFKNIVIFGKGSDWQYHNKNFWYQNQILFPDNNLNFIGDHFRENFCSILSICKILNIDISEFAEFFQQFKGLPHRLEVIGEYHHIKFVDDAISTTPESTIEAIKTFQYQIGTIFLGGEDRGYDFNQLLYYLEKYQIQNIVLFPESGNKIGSLINTQNLKKNIISTTSMKVAVEFAYTYTPAHKICLLSCASPSYSLWKNFEHKGNEFKKRVELGSRTK